MDRKAICEYLVKNEVGEGDLVAFVDYADQGVAAIAHNGMKFTFTNEQLAAAEPKMNPPKPKRAARAKPSGRTAKPSGKRTTAAKKPAAKK